MFYLWKNQGVILSGVIDILHFITFPLVVMDGNDMSMESITSITTLHL